VLSTQLTPDLLAEGVARELVHAIQNGRRELSCNYTDRIEIGIVTDDADIQDAVRQFADYIQSETLGIRLVFGPIDGVEPVTVKIGSASVQLYLKVVGE
jgi:isoleucyl-tRNA synthetase